MSTAVKKGFAIGFVLAAVLGGFWAWREGLWRPAEQRRAAVVPAELSEAPRRVEPARPPATEPEPKAAAAEPPAAAPSEPKAAPPAGPAASSPAAPAAPARSDVAAPNPHDGAFDVVRVEPSGEAVVAGRCAAGCTAELTANGRTIDTAKADAGGAFVMTPPRLPPGDYQLGLVMTAPDGRKQVSGQTVTVSVPATPSRDVVVVLNDPDAPSKILQRPEPVAAPKQETQEKPAASAEAPGAGKPASAPAANAGLSLGAIDAEKGRFFIQGAAPAGAKLRIYLNNALVSEPVSGPDGQWSLRVERGLASGRYVVRVDHVDADGKVVKRAEASFDHEPEVAAASARPDAASQAPAGQDAGKPSASAEEPPAPSAGAAGTGAPQADQANPVVEAIETAKVRRGDSLWRISRATYGHGRRYTIIFDANDDQIRNPNLIYPGQVLVLPADGAAVPKESAR